jgi:hypothetical protein
MSAQSPQFRGDSYCGLYCGACEVLNLYRAALDQGREAQWEDLPEELKHVLPPTYTIACAGCKTGLLSPGCQVCDIRICASGKGVEACVLCVEFPCELVQARQARKAEVLEAILPHLKAQFREVDRMRDIGYVGWCEDRPGEPRFNEALRVTSRASRVDAQAARWLCPQCGAPFTWYQESCKQCGLSLDVLKEHNTIP